MFKISVLETPPISGEYNEYRYNAAGDCTWVHFQRSYEDRHEEWIGIFGTGFWPPTKADAVLFPKGDTAFIIAGGAGYCIDLTTKAIIYESECDYLAECVAIETRNVIVCNDGATQILIFDERGMTWKSERIGSDEIKFGAVEHELIHGTIYDCGKYRTYTLNFTTKKLEISYT